MLIKREKTYKINNVDSFVHCLHESRPAVTKENIKKHIYHYHEYIELLYFPDSEGVVWINGTKNPFSPGMFIIVNSQKPHVVHFHKKGTIFCIKFLPQVLYDNEQSFMYFKYVAPFISSDENRYIFSDAEIKNTSIPKLLEDIMSEWNDKSVAYELMIRANILRIFVNIFRLWNNTENLFGITNLTPEITKSLEYITKNYQSVTEKDAAELCGLSPNYFSSIFKKQMNISFRDYLVNIKIAEAEKQLLTTTKSITEIAEEVGFSTTSHFISIFRRKKGITPAQFRKTV